MKPTLVLTHGLPGSGKSTWAEQEVAKDPLNRVRVNRDDIREELFGESYSREGKFNKKSEGQVTQLQEKRVREAFAAGKRVYCDDTNLNPETVAQLALLAKAYKADIEQEHFNVPVKECLRRNKKRASEGGRDVPHFVIYGMAKKAYDEDGNIKDFIIGETAVFPVPRRTPGMKIVDDYNAQMSFANPMNGKAVVFVDVDGTLADNRHDQNIAFGRGKPFDFGHFLTSIKDAPVNESVRDLANKMRDEDGLNIIVLTGRSDDAAEELITFLRRSRLRASRLIMKREGDFRGDNEFKEEQLRKLINEEGLILAHSIDDRPRSIRVYEKMGILVSRVPYHEAVDPAHAPEVYEPVVVNTFYGSGHCLRCGQPIKKGNIGPKCATVN